MYMTVEESYFFDLLIHQISSYFRYQPKLINYSIYLSFFLHFYKYE